MFCDFQVYTAKTQSSPASWPIRLVINRDNCTSHRFAKAPKRQNITNIRNFPLKSRTYSISTDRTLKNI